jgi:hypothetical protein
MHTFANTLIPSEAERVISPDAALSWFRPLPGFCRFLTQKKTGSKRKDVGPYAEPWACPKKGWTIGGDIVAEQRRGVNGHEYTCHVCTSHVFDEPAKG